MKMQVQLPVEFALHVEAGPELKAVLADIINRLIRIEGVVQMTQDEVTLLQAKVAEQTSVIESAVTLLNGLHAALIAAAGDPAAVTAIANSLAANTAALAAAVAANTPAA